MVFLYRGSSKIIWGGVPFPHTNFGVKDDLIMSIKVPYVYQNLALKKLKLFGWMLSVVKG